MIIIYSAAAAQSAEIDGLADAYNRAQEDEEREQLTERVFELAGPEIGRRSQSVAKGRLSPDQVHSLAWQALMRGLNYSGMTRFQRLGGSDWKKFVEKLKARSTPLGPQDLGLTQRRRPRADRGPAPEVHGGAAGDERVEPTHLQARLLPAGALGRLRAQRRGSLPS